MKLRMALLAAAAAIGLAASAGSASAAMTNGLAGVKATSASTEQVRWVCNRWGRCWRRPNYYAYGYYGPRYYGYGPGWGWGYRHRGWHHHHW